MALVVSLTAWWDALGSWEGTSLPKTVLLAGRNKNTMQTCSLVGEKPGSRRETRCQDQNTESEGEGGA